ncbi:MULTISPECIES: hemerythrin domain-containing protein [Caballeronia]|jgi:hemerythrin superfamily protein|uniref:hemerythrin domain-containing protein n=1 Tax=Caballeronia TaxID=1827195 RepID=UPI00158B4B95|nr:MULTISPECIES: hemerythrin domain-containing protein [Caballeronia]MCG7399935.1 hemerythrin domain-containing protein [Caballeronia zhejiangensis]MCI1043614.1 hemerythrin domain-containing protein [Caballeronia zhejiangensis]MDR5768961.1 hemerythrin domain-containing protein [Caballeronia sp. LZ028]
MSTAQTPRPIDALDMLEADHRAIEQLFDAFERADHDDFERKNSLVQRACELLTIHTIVEEELLYPGAQNALEADRRIDVDEAYVEHFLVKTLIERFANLRAGEDGFDGTFKVLKENAVHHIEEEETVLFPAVRKTQMDLVAIGAKMAARKAALHERIAETAAAH